MHAVTAAPVGSHRSSFLGRVLLGVLEKSPLDPSAVVWRDATDRSTRGELADIVRRAGRPQRRADGCAADRDTPVVVVADGSVASLRSIVAVLASGRPLLPVSVCPPGAARAEFIEPVVGPAGDDCALPWWESPLWDAGITEGGAPTVVDAWQTAVVCGGPDGMTLSHGELFDAATTEANRFSGTSTSDLRVVGDTPTDVVTAVVAALLGERVIVAAPV